ncbi:MAG: CvpA family protein [Alphaproteobacteria bacterium]|nr:CvpA family protein [Alphaproteobacteria bacterium]
MTALDWILLALGGASALWGLMRGLVREVLSVVGWIASFWFGQAYAAQVGQWLPLAEANDTWRHLAGFVAVFISVLVVCALCAGLMRKLASAVGLGPLDRVLGAMFGALRGLLLLLTLAIVVNLSDWRVHEHWQNSGVAQWLNQTLQKLRPLLPAEFGKYLN